MGSALSLCGCDELGAPVKEEVDVFREMASHLAMPDDEEDQVEDEPAVTAEEQRLFLKVIDMLEKHDEFLSSDAGSEAGDSVAGSPPDMDYGNDEELLNPDALEDAKLKDWELVDAWHKLRHHQLPEKSMAERILKAMIKFHAARPNVIKVPRPQPGQRLIVVGDLHGHLGDLMHILDEHGEPREGAGGTTYIFNGDFVDRGMWGPEVLLCLYCLKLRFPNAVHLNRGNHEDTKMNAQQGNGFRDVHCVRAWRGDSAMMYKLCRRSFLCLPLVHVVGDEICVIHGGLPLDRGVTLQEIDRINRKRDVPMPSCSCLGYPLRQQVTARKALRTKHGVRVREGAAGEIVGKVKKTPLVEVSFDGGIVQTEICGAPELETDLTIVYRTPRQKELQRLDRIFIALLWSDPIENCMAEEEQPGPNTSRGMGARFDTQVTEGFLKDNKLQCLLRSHQKRGDGFETEHSHKGGAPMAVTIFSASNYPGGAGELLGEGNLASVAVFEVDEAAASRPLNLMMKSSKAWAEPHSDLAHWSAPAIGGQPAQDSHKLAEASVSTKEEKESQRKLARAMALEQLWLMIYCYRPELMAFFSDLDKEEKGVVTPAQWASAMRGCLIPDEQFPWEELSPYLATFQDGVCHYMAFLMRYRNTLSSRLESHWCRRALGQLFSKMGEGDQADARWKQLDRNGDEELSYFELRPLLKANLEFGASDIEDDGVYTLLGALDKDCSGFIEKNEFIDAVGRGKEWHEHPERHAKASQEENAAIDHCWGFLHGAMRALSMNHTSVTKLFQLLDTSHDGQLSRQEFHEGLKVLLGDSQPSLMQSLPSWEPLLWTLIDTDRSGSVSLEELRAALYVTDSMHHRDPA